MVPHQVKGIATDVGNTVIPFNFECVVERFCTYTGLPPQVIDQFFADTRPALERGNDPLTFKPLDTSDRVRAFEQALLALYHMFIESVNEERKKRGRQEFREPVVTVEKFYHVFADNVSWYDKKRAEFLKKLSKRYRIALVTNMDPIHLYHLANPRMTSTLLGDKFSRNPTGMMFESYPVIASCEVRACKPEPAMWERTAEVLNLSPEEIIFVDDSETNVNGWIEHWRKKGIKSRGILAVAFNFYRIVRSLAAEGVVWDGMEVR